MEINNDKIVFLGGLLKRIDNIDFSSFKTSKNERLKFQKTVYLLKIFGFDFGFDFNWYVNGPYSTELATVGYNHLVDGINKMDKIKFLDEDVESNFKKFLDFLGSNKSDPRWLELIASIHFLNLVKNNKSQIEKIILSKETVFKKEEFDDGWEYLKRMKIIGD